MGSRLPLILLPPSEGKAPGGDGPPWGPGTMAIDLDEQRERVLAALTSAMRGNEASRAKLLGVRGAALASSTRDDRAARTSPTLPAIRRYTGVLYDALDAASLTARQRRRLNDTVLIFSGLWGVVAPTDPIPAYRLKMGAALPRLGKLSSWWRHDLSERVAEHAEGRRVWNLLPREHEAAWEHRDGIEQVTVRFLERRPGGTLAPVTHRNKILKGVLVRLLLTHPSATPDDLATLGPSSGLRVAPHGTEHASGRSDVSLIDDVSD